MSFSGNFLYHAQSNVYTVQCCVETGVCPQYQHHFSYLTVINRSAAFSSLPAHNFRYNTLTLKK